MKGHKQLMSSTNPNWRTPMNIIRAIHRASGGQWLDLATDDGAREAMGEYGPVAWYEPDGDEIEQCGNVFDGCLAYCNPPYGRDVLRWVEFAASMHDGVMLLPARTDTKWFQRAANLFDVACFIAGRLKFNDGTTGAPFPSVLLCTDYNAGALRTALESEGVRGIWVDLPGQRVCREFASKLNAPS